MAAADAFSALVLGFCFGLIGREVLSGWADIFRRLGEEIRLLVSRQPEPTPVAPEPVAALDEIAILQGWARLNPWYAADAQLTFEAQSIHTLLRHREPHLSLAASLAEMTLEMHRRHPEIVPTRQ